MEIYEEEEQVVYKDTTIFDTAMKKMKKNPLLKKKKKTVYRIESGGGDKEKQHGVLLSINMLWLGDDVVSAFELNPYRFVCIKRISHFDKELLCLSKVLFSQRI